MPPSLTIQELQSAKIDTLEARVSSLELELLKVCNALLMHKAERHSNEPTPMQRLNAITFEG